MARDDRAAENRHHRHATRRVVRRAPRLDVPREVHSRLVPHPSYDPEAFGRFAETFARFMGTGRFLAYMTGFIIVWISINVIGLIGLKWDPYPFILLNLIFSTQASYAAPLILLAQNRQEERDRMTAEQDRAINFRARADMDFLAREVAALRVAVGEVATRDFVRSELRALLADLDERAAVPAGGTDADAGPGARPPARSIEA